jgi:hypothetical protein
MDVSTKSTCFCTIIGCFFRINFILPICDTSRLGLGTICLSMAFGKDLEKVVFMIGVWVFRHVKDGGLFTIGGLSMRDPIIWGNAVDYKAAVIVVLLLYVRMIRFGVMTRSPGRSDHQGAFVSNGTIKVKRIGLSGLWRL